MGKERSVIRTGFVDGICPAHLTVILDTNGIHPGKGTEVISKRLFDMVEAGSEADFELTLAIPETVYAERTYQVQVAAKRQWEALSKSASFFGISCPLDEEDAPQQAKQKLDEAIESYALKVLPLDYSKVDLAEICSASVNREPPFSPNGEKGFRDAMIVQSIIQYIQSLPFSRNERILVVSGDQLIEPALESVIGNTKVSVCKSITEALTHISSLKNGIPNDELRNVLAAADLCFCGPGKKGGLFSEFHLKERIKKLVLDTSSDLFSTEGHVDLEAIYFGYPGVAKIEAEVFRFVHDIEVHVSGSFGEAAAEVKAMIVVLAEWKARRNEDGDLVEAEFLDLKPNLRRVLDPRFPFPHESLGPAAIREDVVVYPDHAVNPVLSSRKDLKSIEAAAISFITSKPGQWLAVQEIAQASAAASAEKPLPTQVAEEAVYSAISRLPKGSFVFRRGKSEETIGQRDIWFIGAPAPGRTLVQPD